jgi:molybdate transport system substrate-binding protein
MRRRLALFAIAMLAVGPAHAGEPALTLAVASNLKGAMQDLVAEFKKAHADARIEVVPGSSGKFAHQIGHGAPYDLFFSADVEYPQQLVAQGHTVAGVRIYARGRLALWSVTRDVHRLTLADLADPSIGRIAIANPKVAPYGRLARQALQRAGTWEAVQDRLVYGENVSQALQFAERGAADVALVPLPLVHGGPLRQRGRYVVIPDRLSPPLDQGYVMLKRSAGNPLASGFADFSGSAAALAILAAHGYLPPAAAP